MKVSVDTNVLVRAVVGDEPAQSRAAAEILSQAELIAVTLPCLCEFVWVLRKVYGFKVSDITAAIQVLLETGNVEMDRAAVDSGLSILEAGGDFADGVIAFDGRWLGGETFVSFDKKAVTLLAARGHSVRLV
ncbi:MAG: type II toxin-antitoxin system VapC family toxin [Methylococcaceae bacterium]|nr:type II toxin-antitoxin system VapC family toxin [Methylococcaceae bacterium]